MQVVLWKHDATILSTNKPRGALLDINSELLGRVGS